MLVTSSLLVIALTTLASLNIWFPVFFYGSMLLFASQLIFVQKQKLNFKWVRPPRLSYVMAMGILGVISALVLGFLQIPFPYRPISLPVVLSLVVLAPINEELLFRQALFQWTLNKSQSPLNTNFITAALFAISHLIPLLLGSPYLIFHILQTTASFFIGLTLGSIMLSTRSLGTVMWVHCLFNLSFVIVYSLF